MDNAVHDASRCAAFNGYRLVASGTYSRVALAAKCLLEQDAEASVLFFDDETGTQIDFDLRGTDQDILARLEPNAGSAARAPGRPKLGVVAREITLLPRHWAWLAAQPGGASVTLRKLVEEARRANAPKDAVRAARERAYRFISAMAGNLPGFEEAARALFANDRPRFNDVMAAWPADVREYAIRLAFKPGE
jgi:uncharacterized protein